MGSINTDAFKAKMVRYIQPALTMENSALSPQTVFMYFI
jgi:hypothetical protein